MTKPENKEIIIYVLIRVTKAGLSLVQSAQCEHFYPEGFSQRERKLPIDIQFYISQKAKEATV